MRIGFLITARLKSTRLRKKILKELKGQTVIEHIIERAKKIDSIAEVVLCTSTNQEDRPLIELAQKNDIQFFAGHEEDVMQRLFDATKQFQFDYVLGITADNPLFSIHYSNLIVKEALANEYDFIKINGLPLGAATWGMKAQALETVCRIKTIVKTEIWGRLIDQPQIFAIRTIACQGKFNRPDLRLTLDYKEDYEFINHLYENIPFEEVINLDDVISYLNNKPEIIKINQHCIQLSLDEESKQKIDELYIKNLDHIKEIKNKIYNIKV